MSTIRCLTELLLVLGFSIILCGIKFDYNFKKVKLKGIPLKINYKFDKYKFLVIFLILITIVLITNNTSILNSSNIFNFYKFNLKLVALLLTLYALMFSFNKFGEVEIPPIVVFKIKYKLSLYILIISIVIETLIIYFDILIPIPEKFYTAHLHYFKVESEMEFILNLMALICLLYFLFAFFYESYNFVATNKINVKNLAYNEKELFTLILSSSGETPYYKFESQYNSAIKNLNNKGKTEFKNLIIENQKEILFDDTRGLFLLTYLIKETEGGEKFKVLEQYYEENQYKLFAKYTVGLILNDKNLDFKLGEMEIDSFLADYQNKLFENDEIKNNRKMYTISNFLDDYISEIKYLVKDKLLVGKYFFKFLLIKKEGYDKDLYFKKFLTQILTDDYMERIELYDMFKHVIVRCKDNLVYTVNKQCEYERRDFTMQQYISFELNNELLQVKSGNIIEKNFLLKEFTKIKDFEFDDVKFDRIELKKFKNKKSKEIIQAYVLFVRRVFWLVNKDANSKGRVLYINNHELKLFIEKINEYNSNIIEWLNEQGVISKLGFYNNEINNIINKRWDFKDIIGIHWNGIQYYGVLFDENIEEQIKKELDEKNYNIFKTKKDEYLSDILELKKSYQKSMNRYIEKIDEVEKSIEFKKEELIIKNKNAGTVFANIVKHFFGTDSNIEDKYDILSVLKNDEERKIYFKKLNELSNVIFINNLNAYILVYYISLDTVYNALNIKYIQYLQFLHSKDLCKFSFITTLFYQMFHIKQIKEGNLKLDYPEFLTNNKDNIKYLLWLSNRFWYANGGYLDWEYNVLDNVYRRVRVSFDGMQFPTKIDIRGIFNNENLYELNKFYETKFKSELYDFKEFEYDGQKCQFSNNGKEFDKLLKKEQTKVKVDYYTYRK